MIKKCFMFLIYSRFVIRSVCHHPTRTIKMIKTGKWSSRNTVSWFCNSQIKEVLSMLDAFGQKEKYIYIYSDYTVSHIYTEYSYIHFLDVQVLEMGLEMEFSEEQCQARSASSLLSLFLLWFSPTGGLIVNSIWTVANWLRRVVSFQSIQFALFQKNRALPFLLPPFPFLPFLPPSKMENIKLITITQKP